MYLPNEGSFDDVNQAYNQYQLKNTGRGGKEMTALKAQSQQAGQIFSNMQEVRGCRG